MLSWATDKCTPRSSTLFFLGANLLLILEEMTQQWLPTRAFSWLDLSLGLLGLSLGFCLRGYLSRSRLAFSPN